jgi:HD-GYP domain-containing protein (c-di-GMP phosphodiesterase class II)
VEPPPPSIWNQEALVTPALRELLHDKRMSAPAKAQLMHKAAVDMMGRLMRHPSLERVQEFKQGLAEMVDQVLDNDALARGLLRITAHDVYTWRHSVNVGVLSLLLARSHYRGSDAHDLHELAAGFFLHDIGKVYVNPALLNKRGRFTDAERLEMRAHPALGLQMVEESGSLSPEAATIVGQHHERVDGKGYPNELGGAEIHPYAQICALADVYDALTTVRPYKTSLGAFEALRVMRREMVNEQNYPLFEGLVRLLYD